MSRIHRPTVCELFIALAFAITLLPAVSSADEPEELTSEQRQARQKQTLAHMQGLELRRADSDAKLLALIERPLLTYGDSARSNEDGTLWAWGESGRPAAFLELYRGAGANKARWTHAVTLTSTQHVAMKVSGPTRWQPEKTQIEPVAIPDAPIPGDSQAIRLRQLKDLARRFTAHEFWDPDNSRFELRLLVQPVHRYQDAAANLQDGAAFVLAHGTNPEVILLIEALGKSPAESRWHYALARLGSAELHVELDGKDVWNRERTPRVVGSPSDPYWLFFTAVESSE
jgi:hypothetical protein